MTFREKALRIALREIGVHEQPPGSNWGPRVKQYLASAGINKPAPWCMALVNWAYRKAGLNIQHPHEASVGFFEDWAARSGYLVETPERGDIVCYRFDADNWPDHVGIVEEVKGSIIRTVEGNTSLGNDANGGMVMRRNRRVHRCRFVRIPGEAPRPKPPAKPAPVFVSTTSNTGTSAGYANVRVDVTAGHVRLENQRLDNPAVQSRLRRLLARGVDVMMRRSRR